MSEKHFRIDAAFKEYLRKLGKAELKVYLALSMHANNETRTCYPSLETIRKVTGLGRRHILKGLASIEKEGLILRLPGKKGRNTQYYLFPVKHRLENPKQDQTGNSSNQDL